MHTANLPGESVADERELDVRFLFRPIVFTEPHRAVHPNSWLDYTPFAFWIIDALRPSVFVELGCHAGNSYAGFAQAVQTLGLSTACYGVDTWRGDPHAGFFDETVFEEWSAYHDRRFSTFSRLIRSTFDDAREHFTDGSIDLIHLDGYHTFEAASHDFATWLPKLSTRGVALFHDINVREADFGAWRLWERLSQDYPSFEFLHGHGLGVLGTGPDVPDAVHWLLSLRHGDPERVSRVRAFFSRLGAAVVGKFTAEESKRAFRAELASRDSQLAAANGEAERRAREAVDLGEQLTRSSAEVDRMRLDVASAHAQLSDARRQRLVVQAQAEDVSGRLRTGERTLAKRATQVRSLHASVRSKRAELRRRARQVETLTAKIAALQMRERELSTDLDDRAATIVRVSRDLAKVPRALAARDERIAALDAEASEAYEELHRETAARHDDAARRRRLETLLADVYGTLMPSAPQPGAGAPDRPMPLPTAVPDQDRTQKRVGGLRIPMIARSLAPHEANRPTIVMVSHVGPWKPRAGNEYRVARMLRWYQRNGYRIIPVIAPLPGEAIPRQGVESIAAEFGNAVQCHRDGRVDYVFHTVPPLLASLDGCVTRSISDLLWEELSPSDRRTRRLLEMERTFCHDVLASTVLHLCRTLGPHVLQVEYIWMTRVLPLVRGNVLKVVDTIDVFSSIREKVSAFGLDDVEIDAHEEAERLSRADLVVAIQDEERSALERLAPSVPVVTAGVDFDVAPDVGASDAQRVLYLASNNPRNRKGLDDFLRFAWPLVRRRVPCAELLVAGSVSESVAERGAPGVTAVGPVDDVAPLYRQAAIVINPAVAGTGIKIKTLEALCHARPIVTWPNGVEGLDPELARWCLVARDWYEFSELLARALSSSGTHSLDAGARNLVARHVSPEYVYASLDDAFRAFFDRALSAPGGRDARG